jgi:parvulin-like peptidyl-prolyl isomerase
MTMDELEISIQNILEEMTSDVIELLQRQNLLRILVKRMIIDHCIQNKKLPKESISQAVERFYREQKIEKNNLKNYLAYQGLNESDLHHHICLPIKIEDFSLGEFGNKAEAYFLKRKEELDKYIYSILRVKEADLAFELYLRIESGEFDFSTLAQQYSCGQEKFCGGVIGPRNLSKTHPILRNLIKGASPGVLHEPIQVEKWWIVTRLEERRLARFDPLMKKHMNSELFNLYIEEKATKILCNFQKNPFVLEAV